MRETLHTDGNWALVKGDGETSESICIVHNNCFVGYNGNESMPNETYRYDMILDTPCQFCEEAAPEGLRALYRLMVWK